MTAHSSIEGIAYVVPPHVVTSEDIEDKLYPAVEKLGLEPGYLTGLTGIKERRLWDADIMPSDAATLAAEKLLETTGIDRNEIGCIVNTSVCRDYIEPSVACLVQGNLKLPSTCLNFDVSNACLGFVNGIHILDTMIKTNQIKYGLIVNGESSRQSLENTIKVLTGPDATSDTFRENFATLTLGSGAVAMLIAHEDVATEGHLVKGAVSRADTRYNRICLGQMDQMRSDPQTMLKAGVELCIETWHVASKEIENWSTDSINLYAPHQVSIKHTQTLCDSVGIDINDVYLSIQTTGNIGPAGVPVSVKMAEEDGRLKRGDQLALLGVGSGLNCMMMSVDW
ncbi:MAG: 3-oxoacyl-ACP synthase III [Desulfobacterales bacterium]|nr:3-oxoacyl-ACP synthase III [Desulfobacterales bacterium]